MAQLATSVDTTAVTEFVPTEVLDAYAQGYEYPLRTAMGICWPKPGFAGSVAHRFGYWEEITVPAGTKTMTDTFTDTNLTAAEQSITPGIVGFRVPVADEAVRSVGSIGLELNREIVNEGLNALHNRVDSDIFSSITAATNTAGSATDVFGFDKLRAAFAAWRALDVPVSGPVAVCLHHDGFRDLEESAGSTTAPWTAANVPVGTFGPNAGIKGQLFEFVAVESGNIPANASNWAGCITEVGFRKAGIGIVVEEMPSIRVSQGDEATNRAVTYLVFRSWYGVGVTNPNRLLEVLHRT